MNQTKEAGTAFRPISSSELATVVVICRKARGWTQEVLAELTGRTVRTIQRIEKGLPSDLDTRRALARAFEIEDIDFFNKPQAFKTDEQLKADSEAFERNHITLSVELAHTGKELADLAEQINMYSFQQPDEAPPEVADEAACLFDYLRDYGDIHAELAFTDKRDAHRTLDTFIARLTEAGYSLCYALRHTKLVNKAWADPTPWPATIGYLIVIRSGQEPKQIAVPKGIHF